MRIHAAGRTDALITSLRGPSVYSSAANEPFWLVECGAFNTTDTEFVLGLIRWSATGTQGTALTELAADQADATARSDAFNTHTANATAVTGEYARATLGAAKGAGVIWTFGKNGIHVPAGTANGIGFYLPSGTAQHFDFYFIWDE